MTTNDTFTAQANALVAENRRLRVKSQSDDNTIDTLKLQYAEMAHDFKAAQQDWREREQRLITERDQAVQSHSEIESLLNQAADLIIQAATKRGEATDRVSLTIVDKPDNVPYIRPSSHLLGDDDQIEDESKSLEGEGINPRDC